MVLARHVGNHTVRGLGARCRWMHFSNRTHWQIVHVLLRIERDVVDAAVRAINDNIVAIIEFIMKPAVNYPASDNGSVDITRIVDRVVHGAGVEPRLPADHDAWS